MFDLSKLTETVGGLFGNSSVAETLQSGVGSELMQRLGIDPTALEGLAPDQILDLLQQHGIDPSQLAPDQISELLQSLGGHEQLGALADRLLGGFGRDRQ